MTFEYDFATGAVLSFLRCPMPDVWPSYATAVAALVPVLNGLPGKLVGIDGRNGIGKTTLGRYLAWKFNVSLVEADLFLMAGDGSPEYYLDELNRVISFRLNKPRPIIIESVGLFRLLAQLGWCPDFVIYCCSDSYGQRDELCAWLDRYEEQFDPKRRANIVVDMAENG